MLRTDGDRRILWQIGFLVLFVLIVVYQLQSIKKVEWSHRTVEQFTYDETLFRQMNISDEVYSYLNQMSIKHNEDCIDSIAIRSVNYKYDLTELDRVKDVTLLGTDVETVKQTEAYRQVYNQYKMIFSDLKYYPVPKDLAQGKTVSFVNSWMYERTYGGKRSHEGTDLMGDYNVRGYYPVVSITDGVVEKKGWLEKGGWRLGVRSPSGAYFYYAHLESYAQNLNEGDEIKAGQLLGFMGDSGYGKEEGTIGNFDVHLHLGIYLGEGDQEVSVNPYWILRYLQRFQLETWYEK